MSMCSKPSMMRFTVSIRSAMPTIICQIIIRSRLNRQSRINGRRSLKHLYGPGPNTVSWVSDADKRGRQKTLTCGRTQSSCPGESRLTVRSIRRVPTVKKDPHADHSRDLEYVSTSRHSRPRKKRTCPTEWLTRARPDNRRDFLKMTPMTELRTMTPVALAAEYGLDQSLSGVNERLTKHVVVADLLIVRKSSERRSLADIRDSQPPAWRRWRKRARYRSRHREEVYPA
jgi:hypothetical protein